MSALGMVVKKKKIYSPDKSRKKELQGVNNSEGINNEDTVIYHSDGDEEGGIVGIE